MNIDRLMIVVDCCKSTLVLNEEHIAPVFVNTDGKAGVPRDVHISVVAIDGHNLIVEVSAFQNNLPKVARNTHIAEHITIHHRDRPLITRDSPITVGANIRERDVPSNTTDGHIRKRRVRNGDVADLLGHAEIGGGDLRAVEVDVAGTLEHEDGAGDAVDGAAGAGDGVERPLGLEDHDAAADGGAAEGDVTYAALNGEAAEEDAGALRRTTLVERMEREFIVPRAVEDAVSPMSTEPRTRRRDDGGPSEVVHREDAIDASLAKELDGARAVRGERAGDADFAVGDEVALLVKDGAGDVDVAQNAGAAVDDHIG